jgi:hypothetical protein
MKKFFSIFLSVLFLASAVGVTINSHFCGMRLQSISITPSYCCCQKDSKMKNNCCKNEIKYLKLNDNYFPSASNHLKKNNTTPVLLTFYFITTLSENSSCILYNDHSPPPRFRDKVIAFRSLLI